jgi:hypothetical protein
VIDILQLAELVKQFNAERVRHGVTKGDALKSIQIDLHALTLQTMTEDPEIIPLIVGVIHLLVDYRDNAIPGDAGNEALQELEALLSKGWLPTNWSAWMAPWVLRGDLIEATTKPPHNLGCTLLRWNSFCDYYAASYSRTKFSPSDQKSLWERMELRKIEVPVEEIHLGGANGVVWFTDECTIRQACPSEIGEDGINGSLAYDRLGLDWSRSWEENDGSGGGASRAVLLSVALEWRSRAERGVRAPIALDGWGSLAFVPGNLPRAGTWPEVGSFTVEPSSGTRGLPEGIHGPLSVKADEGCPVEGCGKVSKRIADRVTECGVKVIKAALGRL